MARQPRRCEDWIGTFHVSKALSISQEAVYKVAVASGIRIRELPCVPRKYHRDDVRELAERSIKRYTPAAAG
jgi:intergrase/recombinase